MKTITLKAQLDFFNELTNMAKSAHISKSELIRQAVLSYKKVLQKNAIKSQMQQASMRLREQSLTDLSAFNQTINDGLDGV